MRMKKESRPTNWILYLAGILLCLTLVSVHLTAGLYARYTTSATTEDAARVARFDVTETGELKCFFSETICPGESVEKEVLVSNNSEVAIAYTILAVNQYENLPLEFSFRIDGVDVDASQQQPLQAGKEAEYSLVIHWPVGKNQVSYAGKVDFVQITLNAAQID